MLIDSVTTALSISCSKSEYTMVSGVAILGSLVLAGGSVGYFTFPAMMSMIIGSLINLSENGMVYPLYMNPPFPATSSFRLYEIANPR